eukprot:ANDGO_02026.mRNA.1 Importin subunit beta-3
MDLAPSLQRALDPATVRSATEELETAKAQQPVPYLFGLCTALQSNPDSAIRSMAAVLLRKAVGNDETWLIPHLSPEERQHLQATIVSCLVAEQDPSVVRKISDAASSFAGSMIQNMEDPSAAPSLWPELFAYALQSAQHQASIDRRSLAVRECALLFWKQLSDVLLNDGLKPFLPQLVPVIQAGIQETAPELMGIAKEAAIAALAIVKSVEEDELITQLQFFLPVVLGLLEKLLVAGDEDMSVGVLTAMVDLSTQQPAFFAGKLEPVCLAMLQIASNYSIPRSIRKLAISMVADLAEEEASAIRKLPRVVGQLLQILFHMLVNIEEHDSTKWQVTDVEDSDLNPEHDFALGVFDQIAMSVGGKQILETVLTYLQQNVSNPDWRVRAAGLFALAHIAEGCARSLVSHVDTLVKFLLHSFHDTHERVRHAAVHCCAQLSDDLAPNFQKQHHKTLLPALIALLDDASPRVCALTCTALVLFVDHLQPKALAPHLHNLLAKMFELLHRPVQYVQAESLSAISAIAEASETSFTQYYDTFIPIVKTILNTATSREYRTLRGKAIEAASLIGLSVGKEQFAKDALEIMQIMFSTQSSKLETDDPQIAYLQTAWVRIAKCLGNDFAPYIPAVVPPLIAQAAKKAEGLQSAVDDDAAANVDTLLRNMRRGEESELISLPVKGLGEKRLTLNTAILQEKTAAFNTLVAYASDLPLAFLPYVKELSQVIFEHFMFPFSEEVRISAWQLAPLLIRCLNEGIEVSPPLTTRQHSQELFKMFAPQLLAAMQVEVEAHSAAVCIACLHECMSFAGEGCADVELITSFLAACADMLKDALENKKKLAASFAKKHKKHSHAQVQDDEDTVRQNEERDSLESVAGEIEDFLAVMMKTNNALAMPGIMAVFWPAFQTALSSKEPFDVRLGTCFVVDLVEKGALENSEMFPKLAQILLTAVSFNNAEVAQAGVYGIGALAEHSPASFPSSPLFSQCVNTLTTFLSQSANKKKSEDWEAVCCNAVSALQKFMKTFGGAHPELVSEQSWGFWMSFLPVGGDDEESRIVHGFFVDQIVAGNTALSKDIGRLIKIFGGIVESSLITEGTQEKIGQILKSMQTQVPADVLHREFSKLTSEEQENLQSVLSKA